MRAALIIAVGGALVGCRSPTQIAVEVSTNVPCASWQGTAIAVGELGPALETKPATTTSTYCDATGHLGTVVAVPSGGDSAGVAFRVVGAVSRTLESCTADAGAGCIVARRALNFIPHASLTLSVPLVSSCEGVTCDPLSTCVAGQCRPATIPDPGQCASQTCGEGALPPSTSLDGGAASDGGSPDATIAGDGAAPDAQASDATPGTGEGGGGLDGSAAGCGTSCALALGGNFTCALRGGGVSCWGQNYLGDLGDGTQTSPGGPGAVIVSGGSPLSGVQGIVSGPGADTSCAFLGGGGVSCWGAGAPLLLGGNANALTATPQPSLAGASALTIGSYHLCVQQGAAISCQTLGTQEVGAFGIVDAGPDAASGAPLVAAVPAPAGSPGPFPQLESSPFFTCVRDGAGGVYCLGDNDSNESDPAPGSASGTRTTFAHVILPGGVAAEEVGLMEQTACARSQGRVFCWGTGYHSASGGLPDGGSQTMNAIVYRDGGPILDAVLLAPGAYHTCVLLSSAQVACWGDNQYHELGRGEPMAQPGGESTVAQLVVLADGGAFAGVTRVASGGYHTCATTTDGTLWCWGQNDDGETAPGDTVARSSPSPVTY